MRQQDTLRFEFEVNTMIPKTIHYCWFGHNEKPKLANKCIESWREFCPDYKIVEWNEDNFDICQYPYAQYCYDTKRWAFLSDFVRLVVVYENGGIYFDTDVEVIKPIDVFLQYQSFYGFEDDEFVATGLGFGAEKYSKTVKSILDEYLSMTPKPDGSFEIIGCPHLNTSGLLPFGLIVNGKRQSIEGAEIFSPEYFNPFDDSKGILKLTNNTYCINHYGKSWMSKRERVRSKLTRPLHRLFGTNAFHSLKK